jgi:hypothetical protein
MKTYSYLEPLSKSIVEYYYGEHFTFRKINIDANKMSTAVETPDYKKIAALITPEKHMCIKCKQQLARLGIICDMCITKLNQLTAEFDLTKTEKK